MKYCEIVNKLFKKSFLRFISIPGKHLTKQCEILYIDT